MELLLGCGHRREKLMGLPGSNLKWDKLVTLDIVGAVKPDILCDLMQIPWAPIVTNTVGERCIDKNSGLFKGSYFDEIHAYEVMEHLGAQGDYKIFFAQFREIFRMLKPGGHFFATVPSRFSPWLWGDPGHTRVSYQESFSFMSQKIIAANRKANTPMSDYSEVWPPVYDFEIVASTDTHTVHSFCLRAIK